MSHYSESHCLTVILTLLINIFQNIAILQHLALLALHLIYCEVQYGLLVKFKTDQKCF